jgi:hypothetical protein
MAQSLHPDPDASGREEGGAQKKYIAQKRSTHLSTPFF